jgi:hypothetical protein
MGETRRTGRRMISIAISGGVRLETNPPRAIGFGEHHSAVMPNKVGFIYMLAGDTGTSNHHAYARASHQHWVQTGPHVMIVGPLVKEMPGYSRAADVADASQPYAMFPGTPYEHLILPVTAGR